MKDHGTTTPVRITQDVRDEADSIREIQDQLYRAVGEGKATRHAVFKEAIRLGLPLVRQRVERQLRDLGCDQ